jgi:hypothetical protein
MQAERKAREASPLFQLQLGKQNLKQEDYMKAVQMGLEQNKNRA